MLRRVVIGVGLACLLGGAAYAADEETTMEEQGADPCSQQLAAVEEAVYDKLDTDTLSEDDVDKINELLDVADEECSKGDMDSATQTLAKVNTMIGKQ